jgi:hypothetical protein
MLYTPQALTGRKTYKNTNIAFNKKTQRRNTYLMCFGKTHLPWASSVLNGADWTGSSASIKSRDLCREPIENQKMQNNKVYHLVSMIHISLQSIEVHIVFQVLPVISVQGRGTTIAKELPE